MSGQQSERIFRAKNGPLPGQRRMSALALTTGAYVERISSVLKRKFGPSRSAAKVVANLAGEAGIGTARKWLNGDNGPSGERLLMLAAQDDDVWQAILELTGRGDAATSEQRARMLRAAAILEGREH